MRGNSSRTRVFLSSLVIMKSPWMKSTLGGWVVLWQVFLSFTRYKQIVFCADCPYLKLLSHESHFLSFLLLPYTLAGNAVGISGDPFRTGLCNLFFCFFFWVVTSHTFPRHWTKSSFKWDINEVHTAANGPSTGQDKNQTYRESCSGRFSSLDCSLWLSFTAPENGKVVLLELDLVYG